MDDARTTMSSIRRSVDDRVVRRERTLLVRVAEDLRDSLGAIAVLCGRLRDDGAVEFVTCSPVEADVPTELDLRGRPDLVDSVLAATPVNIDGQALDALRAPAAVAIPLTHDGGRALAIALLRTPLRDGRFTRLLGVYARQAAATLCEARSVEHFSDSEERARLLRKVIDDITDASAEAITAIDLEGRLMEANAAASGLYGWGSGAPLGETLPHVPVRLHDRYLKQVRALAASDSVRETVGTGCREDGSEFALTGTTLPLRGPDDVTFGLITLARPLPVALGGESVIESLDGLLTRAVLGPACAIRGYAQLLTRQGVRDDPAIRARATRLLYEKATTLSHTLEELMLVARLERGDLRLDADALDLDVLLNDLAVEAARSAPGLSFEVCVDPEVVCPPADEVILRGALAALLANAARRSADGDAVTVEALSCDEGGACISVTDRGPAPGVEAATEVFRPRSPGPDDPVSGLGVGLYLAELVARAHEGRVDAGAADHGGARFTLRLPERDG